MFYKVDNLPETSSFYKFYSVPPNMWVILKMMYNLIAIDIY